MTDMNACPEQEHPSLVPHTLDEATSPQLVASPPFSNVGINTVHATAWVSDPTHPPAVGDALALDRADRRGNTVRNDLAFEPLYGVCKHVTDDCTRCVLVVRGYVRVKLAQSWTSAYLRGLVPSPLGSAPVLSGRFGQCVLPFSDESDEAERCIALVERSCSGSRGLVTAVSEDGLWAEVLL